MSRLKVKRVSTGIFIRKSVSVSDAEACEEMAEQILKAQSHRPTPEETIREIEEHARETLRLVDDLCKLPAKKKTAKRKTTLAKSEGMNGDRFSYAENDARDALWHLGELRAVITRNDMGAIFARLKDATRSAIRARVGLVEPITARGRKAMLTSDRAAEIRHARNRQANAKAVALCRDRRKERPTDRVGDVAYFVMVALRDEGFDYLEGTVHDWIAPQFPPRSPQRWPTA